MRVRNPLRSFILMKMMNRFLSVIGLALLMCGVRANDLSKLDPFYLYVGKWVPLDHPVSVVEASSYKFWDKKGVRRTGSASYGLQEAGKEENTKIFGTLPSGHLVYIRRVAEEAHINGADIVAYGKTVLPWNGREVTFAYEWGAFHILDRAPWESYETPQYRTHLKRKSFNGTADTPRWGAAAPRKSGNGG